MKPYSRSTPRMKDAMKKDPYEATRWISLFFTSEISFLLHLPMYLVPRDEDSTYNKVITVTAVVRRFIHITIGSLIAAALWNIAPASTPEEAHLSTYMSQTTYGLTHSRYTMPMWILAGISTVMWIFASVYTRRHFAALHAKSPVPIPELYRLAHIGLINFAFDLADVKVPTNIVTRVGIILTNCTVGIYLTILIVITRTLILFWGCYPFGTSLAGLEYGPCFQYDGEAQRVPGQACDQPGIICGNEKIRWQRLYADEIHTLIVVVWIAFLIYLVFTYRTRVEYFKMKA